jgi:hypothetical protein
VRSELLFDEAFFKKQLSSNVNRACGSNNNSSGLTLLILSFVDVAKARWI